MSTVFGFLSEELKSQNIKRQYEFLKSKIKLGEDRLDVDVLSEAIDDAPELSFMAAQLHIYAKEQLSIFEDITFKMKYAEMAEQATRVLENRKKLKELSGQITKEKVENYITLHNPEYLDLLKEQRELKVATELFASLSVQFESKKSLLQTQGRLVERKKVIVGGRNND